MGRLIKTAEETKFNKELLINELRTILDAPLNVNLQTTIKSSMAVEEAVDEFAQKYGLHYGTNYRSETTDIDFGFADLGITAYADMFTFEELGINVKYFTVTIDYTDIYFIGVHKI